MSLSTTDTRLGPLPGAQDVLTEVLRLGAQQPLARAIEAEAADRIERHQDCRDDQGRRPVVRNGHPPERAITTGAGPGAVRQPRVHDRRPPGEREKFTSAVLPPHLRKTRGVEDPVPWRYRKGVRTGDFSGALAALPGPDARGLSAGTVTRRKGVWGQEYQDRGRRSLAGKHHVHARADGVHFNLRREGGRQCVLVLPGATADGKKELIAIQDGQRESEQSWEELLLDVQARGLVIDPGLAIGDGALGFWKAVRQVWPGVGGQRCRVHKTAKVLDKLPRGVQPRAKGMPHAIYQAEGRAGAERAFDLFVRTCEAKYPRATGCLAGGRNELLTFHDFPAEHRLHVRTTNVIEGVFATVRPRTDKTKGSGTRVACLTMAFKLMASASRRWRALNGSPLLAEVIRGAALVDGVKQEDAA